MRSLVTIGLLLSLLVSNAESYCNWNNCNGEVQGGDWCNANQEQCIRCGNGSKWCGGSTSSGYCNWSNCNGEAQGGDWCNANQEQCLRCGNGSKWCSSGTSPTVPTPPSPPSPPTPTTGRRATTTRYWDCSGGACGCAYIPQGLSESDPAHCHSNGLFAAPAGNPYAAKFYGTAAVSADLGGANWMGPACGKCWKVTGTSNIPGHEGVTTTLVLRGANFCPPANEPCENGKAHFDIAAPGFDVDGFSLSNTCSKVEPGEVAGFASCGRWMIDSLDPNENCICSAFRNPVLRTACENFRSLNWDNPTVVYEELSSCPPEMVTPCGYPYPPSGQIPGTCARPGTN